MNADKRKEITQVKKEKDEEKKDEIELYDVKMKTTCKEEKDTARADMLQ